MFDGLLLRESVVPLVQEGSVAFRFSCLQRERNDKLFRAKRG